MKGEALVVVDALDKAWHFTLWCYKMIVVVDHKPLLKVTGGRCLDDICAISKSHWVINSALFIYQVFAILRHMPSHAALSETPHHWSSQMTLQQWQTQLSHLTTTRYHSLSSQISAWPNRTTLGCVRTKTANHYRSDQIHPMGYGPSGYIQRSQHDQTHGNDRRGFFRGPQQTSPRAITVLLVPLRTRQLQRSHPLSRPNCHPPSLRNQVLQALHSAHQGVIQMCHKAGASFFWPGMTPSITEMRSRCTSCNQIAPSQPNSSPTPPMNPAYPFQSLVEIASSTMTVTTLWQQTDTAIGSLNITGILIVDTCVLLVSIAYSTHSVTSLIRQTPVRAHKLFLSKVLYAFSWPLFLVFVPSLQRLGEGVEEHNSIVIWSITIIFISYTVYLD